MNFKIIFIISMYLTFLFSFCLKSNNNNNNNNNNKQALLNLKVKLKKLEKNKKKCSWVKTKDELNFKNIQINYKNIWGRKILLDLIKKSSIPYRLAWGTVLGSLRHNGFIDNDGDTDVHLLADKTDKGINIKNHNIYNKSYVEIRKYISNFFNEKAKELYPEYIFDVHISAYANKIIEHGWVLGKNSDIDWTSPQGYLCTITIWDKKNTENFKTRGKRLNYPHVIDIKLNYTDEFNKINGPECISYIYDFPYSSFEGVHKYLLYEYGPSYMIPQSATNNEQGHREYNLGNSKNDDIDDEEINKIKNKTDRGYYSKDIEDKIRNKYGNKKLKNIK